MQDTDFNQPHGTAGRRSGGIAVVAALLLAGGAAAGWYAWQNGWIDTGLSSLDSATGTSAAATTATPAATAPEAQAAAVALVGVNAKVAALEQRLMELNQQAVAAASNATHAESLLVAFAARRAIDKGEPLGPVEQQLRLCFGDTQPNAVDRIIDASARPVTLAALSETFVKLEASLAGGSPEESTWTWLKREADELFVIRHGDTPSPTPRSRLQRTRAALAGGRVEDAVLEVERMPGRDAATEWLASARDFMMTHRALDQIEAAALALPAPAALPAGPASANAAAPAASGPMPMATGSAAAL